MAFPFAAVAMASASSAASLMGAERTNEANIQVAREQMAFQERMARHSYRYAMSDMRKAGLNPILAYQRGGATTPSGAGITQVNELGAAVSGAHSGRRLAADMKQAKAKELRTNAETNLNRTLEVKAGIEMNRSAAEATVARAAARVAKIESTYRSEWLKTPAGKALFHADMIGRAVNPFASSAAKLRRP